MWNMDLTNGTSISSLLDLQTFCFASLQVQDLGSAQDSRSVSKQKFHMLFCMYAHVAHQHFNKLLGCKHTVIPLTSRSRHERVSMG